MEIMGFFFSGSMAMFCQYVQKNENSKSACGLGFYACPEFTSGINVINPLLSAKENP